jgi:hypothetical protein
MSRIYFHTKNHEALEVWGGERRWLAGLCNDMLLASLNLHNSFPDEKFCERLLDMLHPKDHHLFEAWERVPIDRSRPDGYPKKDHWGIRQWLGHYRTSMVVPHCGSEAVRLKIAGHLVDIFNLALNTAVAGGSMPIKLAARIHGQCECYGYFKPEAWPWLAETIEEALARGIFRKWIWGRCPACDHVMRGTEDRETCPKCKGTGRSAQQDIGWQGLLKFLQEEEPELIVMSYSVCEGFPPSAACKDPEDPDPDPTWDEGVEWLMSQPKSELLGISLEMVTEPKCVYFGEAVITGWMAEGWEDGGVTVG